MTRETASNALGLSSTGKLYQRRAVDALPRLVRQANARRPIHYRELAREMGMPNERNLNYVLGSVGTSLAALGKRWGEPIPRIQTLVTSRANGLPGPGFMRFYPELKGATNRVRKQIVDQWLAKVYTYPRWGEVLAHFGLVATDGAAAQLIERATALGPGGEGPAHLALKEFVAANPWAVGVTRRGSQPIIEYPLPSGDEIDVLFRTRRRWIAVEVKPANAVEGDLVRGVFQCVKYNALLDAVASADNVAVDVDVILALGGTLTPAVRKLANTLGIDVRERIGPSVHTR